MSSIAGWRFFNGALPPALAQSYEYRLREAFHEHLKLKLSPVLEALDEPPLPHFHGSNS
jgi:hypothetical protein